jgi:formylmethanofuran dehydrogenase subunit C
MKTNYSILLLLSFFSLSSFTSKSTYTIQDTKTIEAIYEGKEDYGYNFMATRDDESEYTITFQNINEELLNQFDLASEALVGKNFKITYQTKIKKTKDEFGFIDEEEILTIINLEAL